MTCIALKHIQEYRARTFSLLPSDRVKTKQEAVDFVNRRGFVYFWPIKGVVLPNLWSAVAGDRPVADAHDDPGHITWRWKDELLGGEQWYYAKVLRRKATMIALDVAPYFYALSENYGSPDEDYLTLYEQGRLTQEARAVYEALLYEGALDTIALKRATRLASKSSQSRFDRALAVLQADFKVLPVGVAKVGSWRYAFLYDIVARHYPTLPEQAYKISEDQARQRLAQLYFRSLGVAQMNDLMRLFGWSKWATLRTVERLMQAGILKDGLEVEDQAGEWIALPEIAAQA